MVGSAMNVRFFAVSMTSSELGVGFSNCVTFDASASGLVPAGNGADWTAPTPVVSLTFVSQYQRAPSGETCQLLIPVATVARLASLPIVCIFSTSAPEALARADQAIVSLPGTGKPTWKCVTFVSDELAAITVSI